MEEKIEKRAKKLRSSLNRLRENPTCCACFGVVREEGEDFVYTTAPCHAALADKEASEPLAVVSLTQHTEREAKKEPYANVKPYYQWLFNDSFYAPIFVTKKPWEGYRSGIIVDPHASNRLVLAGLVATRLVSERPELLEVWNKFVEEGISPSFAFLLTMTCRRDLLEGTIKFGSYYSGHIAISADSFNISRVKDFCLNDREEIANDFSLYEDNCYRSFTNMFLYGTDVSLSLYVGGTWKQEITGRVRKGLLKDRLDTSLPYEEGMAKAITMAKRLEEELL